MRLSSLLRGVRIALVACVIALLLSSGVIVAATMQHEAHMAMTGCPFMPGEKTICLMDVFDHMAIAQQIAAVVVPLVLLYLIVWMAWGIVALIVPQQHARPPSRQQSSIVASLFEQLFADGILHPKAP